MKKRILWLLGLVLVVTLKMFFLVPVHISGGFAGVNKNAYVSLLSILKDNSNCMDCFNYDIIYSKYLIELFFVIAFYLIVYFIYKKVVKKSY